MAPRQAKRPTAPEIRDRNTRDLLGRPGFAGLARIGGIGARGGGGRSVLADLAPDDSEPTGSAQLLVMSVEGVPIEPGGASVPFDTVLAMGGGFEDAVAPMDGAWPHPISGVYSAVVKLAWTSFTGGGTVRLLVNGVAVPEGLIVSGTSGAQAFGLVQYEAEAGSFGQIEVTHTDAAAQLCDAMLSVAITDPEAGVESEVAGEWSRVFAGRIWGIVHDGTNWWTTEGGGGVTVSKRDADGVVLDTFEASALDDLTTAHSRGITWDGTHLWVTGSEDIAARYTTAGVLDSSFAPEDSPGGHTGLAWDGTHLWVIEGNNPEAERYTTAGALASKFSLPAGAVNGAHFHDGDLWIVVGEELHRYTTAGVFVSSITVPAGTLGVWIAADGTVYVAVARDGVYVRATVV